MRKEEGDRSRQIVDRRSTGQSHVWCSRVLFRQVLANREDLWGNQLLQQGPVSYDAVAEIPIPPILYMYGPRTQGNQTSTQVHYVPFGQPNPDAPTNPGPLALQVADGSQVFSNTRFGTQDGNGSMQIYLSDFGGGGKHLFGSCLSQLQPAQLLDGWLPALTIQYHGFSMETFATRLVSNDTGSLASFYSVSTGNSRQGAPTRAKELRFEVCRFGCSNLRLDSIRHRVFMPSSNATHLFVSAGGRLEIDTNGSCSVVYNISASFRVWVIRPVTPFQGIAAFHTADDSTFTRAREQMIRYWTERVVVDSVQFDVPEPRVMAAMRALLVQNLLMTWRYSVGNAYEAFYQPESSSTGALDH